MSEFYLTKNKQFFFTNFKLKLINFEMGRPKGSKNRPKTSLPADLLEELREQEEGFVERDNFKVLDVANGLDESESELDESSDSDFDPKHDLDLVSLHSSQSSQSSTLPELVPSSSSKPPPSTQPVQQSKPSSSKSAASRPLASSTQVASSKHASSVKPKSKANCRVKKPLDAVELTQRNLELFKRAMEARQNNQFELLNENFRMFSSTLEHTNKKLYKLINVSLLNFNKYNSNLAIHKASIKVEPKSSVDEVIILDDDPQSLYVESKFSVPAQRGKSANFVPSSQHNQSQPAYSNLTAPIKTERYAVDYERLVTVTSKTNDTT